MVKEKMFSDSKLFIIYKKLLLGQVQFKPLTKEQEEILSTPLPPEALKHVSFGAFKHHSINSSYLEDILNRTFGLNGWIFESEIREIEIWLEKDKERKGIEFICRGSLLIPQYGIYREAYGGNSKDKDAGDAAKGAATDAFTKICASIIDGVGAVWKNQYDEQGNFKGTSENPITWIKESALDAQWKMLKEAAQKGEETLKDLRRTLNEKGFAVSKENYNKLLKLVPNG